MVLPITPDPKFNPTQLKAWKAMIRLLRDPTAADRRYDALRESAHGRIISTDLARFLDERYAKPPRRGNTRDMAPGWDLAWRYAQDRFERELRSRGKRKVVRFMAGGWAAGKTHALEHMLSREDLDSSGGLHYTAAHESYYLQAASQIGEAAASSD
ncbi:MAG: hypothetical protein NTW21_02555 [Verrucomicrobia bacterium]|nr:hypothetical protein [Verrucomicrobiota bacterium]